MMRLIVITSGDAKVGSHEGVARAAVASGCRAIQMRDKEMADRLFADVARRLRRVCDEAGALFFVNDRVDVASAVDADGVHLGVEDLRVTDARKLLARGAIVGYSPVGLDDAREAIGAGADYLGVGPVFSTGTKEDAGEAIGPEGLSAYVENLDVPVIAVGGIDAANLRAAIDAGATGVAVVSAVAAAPSVGSAVREMLGGLEMGLPSGGPNARGGGPRAPGV
jgi:thiamine-phosphate diphosphorylase